MKTEGALKAAWGLIPPSSAKGRLPERLKGPAWKAVRCNSYVGSNPIPSARLKKSLILALYIVRLLRARPGFDFFIKIIIACRG